MRKKDIDLVAAILDETRVTPEVADRILGAMRERYAQETQVELVRQRSARLKNRETWVETDVGKHMCEMEPGDWFIIPADKRNAYRSAKNALNRLEVYGRWTVRAVNNIGDIVTRIA